MSSYYARQAQREMECRANPTRKGAGKVDGRPAIANRRPGPCHYCGAEVPAEAGLAVKYPDGWRVQHRPQVWQGSPVSGQWVDGCTS